MCSSPRRSSRRCSASEAPSTTPCLRPVQRHCVASSPRSDDMSQDPPSTDELTAAIDLVDALEDLVGGARRLPFTPSVVVNEEEILELVDRIRLALPDDLR